MIEAHSTLPGHRSDMSIMVLAKSIWRRDAKGRVDVVLAMSKVDGVLAQWKWKLESETGLEDCGSERDHS